MTGEAIARVRARRSGNLAPIRPKGSAAMSDIDTLERLNRDYISSVQNCDVARFNEILAPEFYCSNPDGTLIDRAAFLKQTAIPVTITGLEARDVVIRLFGPPGQKKHRDHPRAHRLQDRRRRGQIRPLHRCLGAAGRDVAGGFRARHPGLTGKSPAASTNRPN